MASSLKSLSKMLEDGFPNTSSRKPSKAQDSEDPLAGVPESVQDWLLGVVNKEPEELTRVMDQASTKINMALAFTVIRRLSSMGKIHQFLTSTEEIILDEDRIRDLEPPDRIRLYKALSKVSSDFFEFVRKLVLQNKEMFDTRRSSTDELADLLRDLDPAVVRELLSAVRKKGAATTVESITGKGETVSKSKNSLLEELIS